MRRELLLKLPLLVVILGSVGASSKADDPQAEAIAQAEAALKGKGLTKTMSTWVIEDEKPILARLKEIRAEFSSYAQLADRQAEAEQLAATSKQLDQERTQVQNNLNSLNQQIASAANSVPSRMRRYNQQTAANNPLIAEKSQLTNYLAEVNQTQKNVKSQIPAPKDKAALDDQVKKKKESFKLTLTDLRKEVDAVTKKYADLADDQEIKKSIDSLKTLTKAKIKLGPSEPFLALMKDLDKAEQHFLGKTPPASTSTTKHKAKAKK